MKIIFFGATGYLAKWVYMELVSRGHRVYPVVRNNESGDQFPGAEKILHVADVMQVRDAIRMVSPDLVINMSNYFSKTNSVSDVVKFSEVNTQLIHEICTGCIESDAKLLHIGSAWQSNFSGGGDISLGSSYGLFKGLAINIVKWFSDSYNLNVCVLNLYDTYGPNDPRGKIISYLSSNLGNENPILLSPGEQVLELVYTSDVAAAVSAASEYLNERSPAENGNYLLEQFWCYPEKATNLREIAAILELQSGLNLNIHWGAHPYREGELFQRNIQDKRLIPGWNQKVSLDHGLRTVLAG